MRTTDLDKWKEIGSKLQDIHTALIAVLTDHEHNIPKGELQDVKDASAAVNAARSRLEERMFTEHNHVDESIDEKLDIDPLDVFYGDQDGGEHRLE